MYLWAYVYRYIYVSSAPTPAWPLCGKCCLKEAPVLLVTCEGPLAKQAKSKRQWDTALKA